jgi:hypothetical protein
VGEFVLSLVCHVWLSGSFDANSAWHSVPQLMGQIRGRWGHGKIHFFARDLMQGHVSRDNREVKALLL